MKHLVYYSRKFSFPSILKMFPNSHFELKESFSHMPRIQIRMWGGEVCHFCEEKKLQLLQEAFRTEGSCCVGNAAVHHKTTF
jgi:hypothetical protein